MLPFDLNTYKDALAQWESSDNYGSRNRLGYLGRYQLGASALVDAGFVKPGTTNKGLKNPKNWLKGNMDKFLNNPALQEKAFEAYTKRNFQALLNKGLINPDSSPAEAASVLAAAHLVGPTGAHKALVLGQDVRDANNMKPQTYMQRMSQVFGGTPTAPQQTQPSAAALELPPEEQQASGTGLNWGSMVDGFNVESLVNPLMKAKNSLLSAFR